MQVNPIFDSHQTANEPLQTQGQKTCILSGQLELSTEDSDVAFTFDTPYKLRISYGTSAFAMCTERCLHNPGANVYLVYFQIPPAR